MAPNVFADETKVGKDPRVRWPPLAESVGVAASQKILEGSFRMDELQSANLTFELRQWFIIAIQSSRSFGVYERCAGNVTIPLMAEDLRVAFNVAIFDRSMLDGSVLT